MMSYHNLHLLRCRRPHESNVSKENNESGSDNNNHNVNNKQHLLSSSASSTTMLTIQKQNQQSKRLYTKDKTSKHSRIWFFTNCCRSNPLQKQEKIDKRSSSTTSSRATPSNNILVDYCTYHDVAISRVTCV